MKLTRTLILLLLLAACGCGILGDERQRNQFQATCTMRRTQHPTRAPARTGARAIVATLAGCAVAVMLAGCATTRTVDKEGIHWTNHPEDIRLNPSKNF